MFSLDISFLYTSAFRLYPIMITYTWIFFSLRP
jgi:hypothetical protein